MASSYQHMVEKNLHIVSRLVSFSGLDESLVKNLVKFSKCLCKLGSEDAIDCDMFCVVMSAYFHIIDQTALLKFFSKRTRRRTDGKMSVEDFAKVLCTFLTDNIDVKIDYVFQIYDINGDGQIDKSEIINFAHTCTNLSDTDDGDKDETFYDLSDMASKILGVTPDRGLNLERFRARVKENNLVLSILGEALPKSGELIKFRQMIEGKTNMQMIEMFKNIRYKLLREVPSKREPRYYPITLDLP